MKQSIIIPYYKNKQELYFVLNLLFENLPQDVEIIVVANNPNSSEREISYSNCKIIKIDKALLYSKAANIGVAHATGDIITLMDQDIFVTPNWYLPLLKKLLSDKRIGAVSSKMINPTNNRILEYGIEYTPYNSAHIGKDLSEKSPLVNNDICVSSACGGILMTYKSLYNQLGGMDEDMPYICCDCDYTLKLWESGKQVWIVADSVVFHKSYTSKSAGKISDFSFLENDSRWKFYQKNSHRMRYNLNIWMSSTFQYFMTSHVLLKYYIIINLSSYNNINWYKTFIKTNLNIEFYDEYTFLSTVRNLDNMQIYDYVPFDFTNFHTPIIYFVDSFISLKDNALWYKMRNISRDIIIDINGAICSIEELQNGIY
ncbi:MAG: glycosyltransferase [Clostridia bacterium]|nr:glycosyltransferase [Clostridia bacterium]